MLNIFQFLQDNKGKKVPLLYKLLNNLPLTKDDLFIDGDLNLMYSEITYLPDNLTVNGRLILYQTKIKSLPNNLRVKTWLNIENTDISVLPDDLYVGNDLYCLNSLLIQTIKKDLSLLTKYKEQVKGDIIYEW